MTARLTLLAGLLAAGCGPAGSPAPVPVAPAAPAPPPAAAEPPLFEDATAGSGLAFAYRNGEDTADHYSILESLGGGAAVLDFDRDGRPDVYLPGGGGYGGPDKKQIVGRPGGLFRNLGGLKFEDATAAAGLGTLAGGKPWFYSHAAAAADFDRDGWPDLLVTGWGAVALFRNVPADPADPAKGRRLEDVTAAAGLAAGWTWATSAAFADLDGDGWPDLYVCQYVDWSWANNPACSYDSTTPDVCPPKYFSGLPHRVFRNDRGRFADVSAAAGLKPGGPAASKGLGALAVDADGDGKPDLYAANDTTPNFLYLNRSTPGSIRLEEVGETSWAARDDRGGANGSMGVDAGDPDRTGKPYLWVTNYENELHALYRNAGTPGKPLFFYHTHTAGVTAIGQRYVGWGTAFLDADLDGWEDLFVANGHAIRHPTGRAVARKQQPVLLRNDRGKFRDVSARLGAYGQTPRLARGVGFADFDNDGRPDMVVSHVNEPAAVLRGVGGAGRHWLGVELVGKDHACTVGAKVTVQAGGQTQTRFAKGGGSYASSNDRRLLFGLADATAATVTVTWPDGSVQAAGERPADAYHRIARP